MTHLENPKTINYTGKKKEEKNYEGEKIELIEGAWHCHLRVG